MRYYLTQKYEQNIMIFGALLKYKFGALDLALRPRPALIFYVTQNVEEKKTTI